MKIMQKEELYSIKKAVVIPFCMTSCLTGKNHGWYECDDCYRCQISNVRNIAYNFDYRTLLVGSQTMQSTMQEFLEKNHKIEKMIGIICPQDIANKTQKIGEENIPKIFGKYDTYLIPKFCIGEADETQVWKDFIPSIDLELLLEKLKKL